MAIDFKIQLVVDKAFLSNCRNVPNNTDYIIWRYHLTQAADAILWYISTGRASAAECNALLERRMYYVLRHMAMMTIEDEDASTDHLIALMKNYPGLKKLYA